MLKQSVKEWENLALGFRISFYFTLTEKVYVEALRGRDSINELVCQPLDVFQPHAESGLYVFTCDGVLYELKLAEKQINYSKYPKEIVFSNDMLSCVWEGRDYKLTKLG